MMKKILYLFLLSAALISCKNSEENSEEITEETSEYKDPQIDAQLPIYRGEFYYTEGAAVLKGENFIYGVVLDANSKELAEKVETIKQDEFDMVPVVVQGVLSKKPEGQDGWDEVLAIKNIIRISKEPTKADVKIEAKN